MRTTAAALPQGMATADLARYRELFDLQRRGHWAEAEALMPMLGDNLLLGHLLAQRLLSPKAPRADYAELAAWLEKLCRPAPGRQGLQAGARP